MNRYKLTLLFILVSFVLNTKAQQLPDTSFMYKSAHPAYDVGGGPAVFIDGAHNNFHTKDGNFYAFGRLLEQDGYRVLSLDKCITDIDILHGCKILVIANPLHASDTAEWVMPNPSAFSEKEIKIIKQWVEQGGRLLLIADHMPFAGATYELGKAFGFEYVNGFAFTKERSWPPSIFTFQDSTLNNSPIVKGMRENEGVNRIITFTGSAFKMPSPAIPVLSFKNDHYSLQPDTAWSFKETTPIIKLGNYHQGAVMKVGKGKIAVFGEAAMFTAQIANGTFKVGMNSDDAPQNAQFVLNLIHWLDGLY